MAKAPLLSVKLTKTTALEAEEVRWTLQRLEALLPRLSDLRLVVVTGGTADAQGCGSHACDGHSPRPPDGGGPGGESCPGHSSCDTEACSTHVCSSHECDANGCSAHACSDDDFGCAQHTVGAIPAAMSSSRAWSSVVASLSELSGTWTGGATAATPR